MNNYKSDTVLNEVFCEKSWTPEEFLQWAKDTVEDAKSFTNPVIIVGGGLDFDGYPETQVSFEYQVPLTEYDIKEQERYKEIERIAEEKDITFYEASTLLSLRERGKL